MTLTLVFNPLSLTNHVGDLGVDFLHLRLVLWAHFLGLCTDLDVCSSFLCKRCDQKMGRNAEN